MKVFKEIWYVFNRKQKVQFVELMILILIGTSLETLGVAAIVPFINAIMSPEKMLQNEYVKMVYDFFHLTKVEHFIILLALALILVYVLKNAFLCIMYLIQFKFVHNNQVKLSNRLMLCYLNQPYAYHLQHNSAGLQTKVNADVENFFTTVLQLINVLTDGCVCLALFAVLFITDKSITMGVAGLVVVFILTFYRWFKAKMEKMGIQRRIYAKKSIQALHQAFGGIKEIKVLGEENFFAKQFNHNHSKMVDAKRQVNTFSMMPKPIMETLCIAGLMIVVSIKIYRGVDMEYFVSTLSVFALAVIRILPSSSRLSSNLSNLVYGKASVDAIYDDIKEIEVLELNTDSAGKRITEQICFEKEFAVKDVCFAYENSDRNVLDGASLVLPKNKMVAFVGASGAGKTTLADIILGILQIQSGDMLVDGVSVKDNMPAWQKKLGYIPQTIYIIDDTIRRNVAFASKDEDIDDAMVWKALEDAQLKEFVEGLEDGLDTVIGERGSRISGGQRQRIGIARALYRDPDVLVLDEATSALDNETEKAIMDSIEALSGKKTMLIIAHRLTTIQNCDYVYRIENGKATLEKGEL